MHLHGLSILHGGISPVSKANKLTKPRVNGRCVQSNILITWDGQARLGDFGIVGAFRGIMAYYHKLGTLRYMAPELFLEEFARYIIGDPSKEGDVYSFAMTSFEVRSVAVNSPPI